MRLRIATFNVENLFSRKRILNLEDHALVDELLNKVRMIQKEISKKTYTDAVRTRVAELSLGLSKYIDFRVDSGKFGDWVKKDKTDKKSPSFFSIGKSSTGKGSWNGELIFKEDTFSDIQRKNTAKVIKEIDADIMCCIEVEGMEVLRRFNSDVLGTRKYGEFISIDSPNDPRGIDVACLTKHKILSLRTHVFDDGTEFKPVFSRDCLEVSIDVGLGKPIFVLCNHFKSQGGKSQDERDKSARKRKEQTQRVIEIISQSYNLKEDYVVVLGDLNEDSGNQYQSLKALFEVSDFHPVVDPSKPRGERYTYYYASGSADEKLSQLDYIFLSSPLFAAVQKVGFERRGIAEIDKITGKFGLEPVTPFPGVTTWNTAASDHAGLWVDLEL